MKSAQRMVVTFSDTYPFVGPIVWILSVQYLLVQPLVAAAWSRPYSWAHNLISDLGNTACGQYSGRYVCSPQHGLMNASFIILGCTMALGALLIYREFQETRGSRIGFSLMGLGGVGSILVGSFPENTTAALHFIGALLALVVANVSLVVLAASLQRVRRGYRVYTALSGSLSLVAFGLFLAKVNLGLGQGGMERLVSYPLTLWLTLFGLYMSAVRMRARRAN